VNLEDDATVVRCSPFDNLCAVPQWNGKVSVYEINPNPMDNNKIREVIFFNNNPGAITLSSTW